MAAEQEKAQEEKKKVEIQTNCLNCNKPMKRIKRYYRDGKFYCNKRCWKDYVNKAKKD